MPGSRRQYLAAFVLSSVWGTGCFQPNPNQVFGEDDTGSSSSAQTTNALPTTAGDASETSSGADSTGSSEGTASADSTSGPSATDCDPAASRTGCAAPTPFCVDELCTSCADAGGDDFCRALDPQTGACHPDGGMCLGCVDNGDCGDDVCTSDLSCQQCTRHADCPDSACNLETQQCMNTNLVLWVDGTGCGLPEPPNQDPGFGSENQPYCWLSTALDAVDAGETAIVHVIGDGSTQGAVDVSLVPDRTLALLGDDQWTLDTGATALRIENGTRAFVDRVRVEDASQEGIRCSGASSLWVTDSLISRNAVGISADACERLTLERTQIEQSATDAVAAVDSDVHIMSSTLVRNGSTSSDGSALRFVDSTFSISYSTLVANLGAAERSSVFCSGGGGGTIRNSVVVSSSLPSFDCPSAQVQRGVFDDEPMDGQGVVVLDDYDSSWFADLTNFDAHVADPSRSPFADGARWALGDPRVDLDGEPRDSYPGLAEFAGADQP